MENARQGFQTRLQGDEGSQGGDRMGRASAGRRFFYDVPDCFRTTSMVPSIIHWLDPFVGDTNCCPFPADASKDGSVQHTRGRDGALQEENALLKQELQRLTSELVRTVASGGASGMSRHVQVHAPKEACCKCAAAPAQIDKDAHRPRQESRDTNGTPDALQKLHHVRAPYLLHMHMHGR